MFNNRPVVGQLMECQRRVRDASILQSKDSLDIQWAQRIIPSPNKLLHLLLDIFTVCAHTL
jgi:hypothetical protein